MSNEQYRSAYPRKIVVLSDFFGYIETTANDLLPCPSAVLALFQAESLYTDEMRTQALEVLAPYAASNEDHWVFDYREGNYTVTKASWKGCGYEAGSLSELLERIVRYYYTWA